MPPSLLEPRIVVMAWLLLLSFPGLLSLIIILVGVELFKKRPQELGYGPELQGLIQLFILLQGWESG